MVVLSLHLEGDGAFKFLEGKQLVLVPKEAPLHVAGLSHGTSGGKPSVAFAFELPDGRVAFAETTLALFLNAADALRARYGKEL